MTSLEEAISRYRQGLDKLPTLGGDEYEENVLEILAARDAVDAAQDGASVPAATLKILADLDGKLNETARDIRNTVGANKFVIWREARTPPADSWWWRLDERVTMKEEEAEEKKLRGNAVLILLTFFLVTVSLGFIAEISRRFLSGESEWDSILGTFVQVPLNLLGALAGLLTAGTITEAGRHGVQGFLHRVGLLKKTGAVKRFALALAFFCLVLPVRLLLPLAAHYYSERGGKLVRQGDQHLPEAVRSYEQAIKLKPDYAEAHYNLGDAFERLHKCKEAIPPYEAAIRESTDGFPHAQNNLARLYLKCGTEEQANAAVGILEQQLKRQPPPDDAVRYSLLKNLGWAKFKLKYYPNAEGDLKQALELRREGGAAHCLLALTLDALGRTEEAKDSWFDCYAHSSDPEVEPSWRLTAEQKK